RHGLDRLYVAEREHNSNPSPTCASSTASSRSPLDLTKFTLCAHVTTLDLGKLHKTFNPLAYPQRSLHTDFIAQKGTEHEKDYVERLARAGNCVLRIEGDRRTAEDLRNATAATIDAMKSGAAGRVAGLVVHGDQLSNHTPR